MTRGRRLYFMRAYLLIGGGGLMTLLFSPGAVAVACALLAGWHAVQAWREAGRRAEP